MHFKSLTAAFIIFFAAVSSAWAGDQLTEDQARRFAEAIPGMTELAENMKKEGKDSFFEDDYELKAGEPFQPYSAPLADLKKVHPGDYAKVNALAKKHKFKNAVELASVADRTMLAYMSHKMPPGMAAMATAISPDMLNMLPPETRAEYEKSQSVMKALENVPQADKDAVAPVVALLDQKTIESGQKAGAFDKLQAMPGGQ